MKKRIVLSALAAGALLSAAHAGEGKGPMGPGHRWDALDANGDGEISLNEMNARQREFLAEADKDGSGGVSKEELRAHFQEKRAERMGDANGDGAIDKAEFEAAAEKRFAKMDQNGDGVISADEMRHDRRGPHGGRGGE
ncbi:MAG: EF-hand domain-containing protein [Amphiplicatus sp.]